MELVVGDEDIALLQLTNDAFAIAYDDLPRVERALRSVENGWPPDDGETHLQSDERFLITEETSGVGFCAECDGSAALSLTYITFDDTAVNDATYLCRDCNELAAQEIAQYIDGREDEFLGDVL